MELETVIREKRKAHLAIANRIVHNEADAEDVVQNATLQAYRKLGQFRGDCQLSTWLHRIVVRAALMHLRTNRNVALSLDDCTGDKNGQTYADVLVSRDSNPHEKLRAEELTVLADDLPSVLRQTFHLRCFYGLTLEEVATLLDVSIGTIKARYSRAKARLRASAR